VKCLKFSIIKLVKELKMLLVAKVCKNWEQIKNTFLRNSMLSRKKYKSIVFLLAKHEFFNFCIKESDKGRKAYFFPKIWF